MSANMSLNTPKTANAANAFNAPKASNTQPTPRPSTSSFRLTAVVEPGPLPNGLPTVLDGRKVPLSTFGHRPYRPYGYRPSAMETAPAVSAFPAFPAFPIFPAASTVPAPPVGPLTPFWAARFWTPALTEPYGPLISNMSMYGSPYTPQYHLTRLIQPDEIDVNKYGHPYSDGVDPDIVEVDIDTITERRYAKLVEDCGKIFFDSLEAVEGDLLDRFCRISEGEGEKGAKCSTCSRSLNVLRILLKQRAEETPPTVETIQESVVNSQPQSAESISTFISQRINVINEKIIKEKGNAVILPCAHAFHTLCIVDATESVRARVPRLSL